MVDPSAFIHPLANVEDGAEIGAHTKVWQFATVRSGARVGSACIIGQGAFVDSGVILGDKCKLENYASVHYGSRLEDEVFLGPAVVLCNDNWPRASTAEGELKQASDWVCEPVYIARRASVGARAVILPGVRIGGNAMVGAGAVVTRDVAAWAVVLGNPARLMKVVPEEQRSKL